MKKTYIEPQICILSSDTETDILAASSLSVYSEIEVEVKDMLSREEDALWNDDGQW